MAITILSTDRILSTKYQIPLWFNLDTGGDTSIPTEVKIEVQQLGGFPILYQTFAQPYTRNGDVYSYRLDLSPALDTLLSPPEFVEGLAIVDVYNRDFRVLVQADIINSASYTTKFYRFRLDYYTYWKNVSSNLAGATFPASQMMRRNLNCYIDGRNASALQVWTNDPVTAIDVDWNHNAGSQAETINLGTPAFYGINIGIDELLPYSALFTEADRLEIPDYEVATTTAGAIHVVTVHNTDLCPMEPFSITYLNEYGVWESLAIPAMWKERLDLNQERYRVDPLNAQQVPPSGIAGNFFSRDIMLPSFYSSNIRRFEIVTDWLDEYQMKQFKYAASSQEIWVKMPVQETVSEKWTGEFVSAVIKDKTVNVKKRRSDKIYNLTLNLDLQPINR